MDEGLREVAAKLALAHIELLAEQAGRSAGRAAAFEPSSGGEAVALLGTGQGHPEPAEQERPFGLAEWSFVDR